MVVGGEGGPLLGGDWVVREGTSAVGQVVPVLPFKVLPTPWKPQYQI